MATVRAFLRSRVTHLGSISNIVTDINRLVVNDTEETGQFMTLFYLVINPGEKSLSWVRAGHDPALIYDPVTNVFEELKGPGLALGVDMDWPYEELQKSGLTKGQIIVIGTDGIWETRNSRGETFGKKSLFEIIFKAISKE